MKRISSIIIGLFFLLPAIAINYSTQEYIVRIKPLGTTDYVDQMYLSASTKALDEYKLGVDLIKMKMSTATTAQMWVDAYDLDLSVNKARLVDFEATFPVTFSIPAEGDYALYLGNTITDGTALYLYKGKIPQGTLNTGELHIHLTSGETSTYKLRLVAPKQYYYTRNVATGNWGTICYPDSITAVDNAVVYELTARNSTTTKVAVDVVEVNEMKPGKAYLFRASADEQDFIYFPNTKVAEEIANKGLFGTFSDTTLSAQAWVIKEQQVIPAAVGSSVPAYRAYVDLNDPLLPVDDAIFAPGAPVRAGRKIFNVTGGQTDLENVDANANANGKVIINGKLVLIRDGKMFNAQGARL